ncbi:hypothetical protein HY251_11485, partial [bacterium]|nr:hypothetical protein [bacterium]
MSESSLPRRALAVAPGRGSYGPSEVGWLSRVERESERGRESVARVSAAVDRARARRGLGSIREVDETKPFSQEVHGTAENASALIFAGSCIDAELLPSGIALAGVLGNSLWFYSALEITAALSLEDAATLVVEMAALQTELARGTQLLYPVVSEEWTLAPERERALT